MTNPAAKNQRFLALAGGTMSLLQIARLLKEKMPQVTKQTSLKSLPSWQVRIAAPFSKQAKLVLPMIDVYRNTSNEKAKTILGWQPRSNEEAIIATAESLIEFGHIQVE